MKIYNSMAEYYFDYQVKDVFGGDAVKAPKLYFECDYYTQALQYSLFVVPQEWLGISASAPYDRINIVFDVHGLSSTALSDRTGKAYLNADFKKEGYTREDFRKDGCRIKMGSGGRDEHSGVGMIEMFLGDSLVAKFYFMVNFNFRKKIEYSLVLQKGKLMLKFDCNDAPPQGISVNVIYNKDRLPCLNSDARANHIGSPILLDFDSKGQFRYVIDLAEQRVPENVCMNVVFSDEDKKRGIERYYLLDCIENTTVRVKKRLLQAAFGSYTCPYCHRTIDVKVAQEKDYKKGGIPCRALSEGAPKVYPTIYNKKEARMANCMFCADDLMNGSPDHFDSAFARLLPAKFMEHLGYKIAFMGSTRAGKTTYISRFFGVTGSGDISMNMNMMTNCMGKLGINTNAAHMAAVGRSKDGYQDQEKNWILNQPQYKDRSINLDPPEYPGPTPNSDYTKYPFIVEVNGGHYVSFYDIAGEDAKHTTQVQSIANGELIGVFLLINGNKDLQGAQDVENMLKACQLRSDCPVAVIVTKMDLLEESLDSNCKSLRTDYFRRIRKYEGSDIERTIDFSSEEIRAYLLENGLLPSLDGSFNNVKYFGVSSFNFFDSIHQNKNDNPDEPGNLNFECSGKHLELPFVWMLKQFGVIK